MAASVSVVFELAYILDEPVYDPSDGVISFNRFGMLMYRGSIDDLMEEGMLALIGIDDINTLKREYVIDDH